MKFLNKLILILCLASVLSLLFGISVFAEDQDVFSIDDITLSFKYTSDSVVTEGLTYQVYNDPISNQAGIELIPNFGIGYTIYDNPETEIIDGIRINGVEVTTLRIPITSETSVRHYEIAVKTVYIDGASGDLAQILDGTFDYSRLLTNPIIIFQIAYWVFMALSGFIGLVTISRNKGKKVKTADEIANKVTENMAQFEDRVVDLVTRVVTKEILPLAQASVKSGKEAVKAILLSTSKSKEAPSALLDVFKESSDIDISNIVEEVREELSKLIEDSSNHHADNVAALHQIANNVIQEDVNNAKQESEEPVKNKKSLF